VARGRIVKRREVTVRAVKIFSKRGDQPSRNLRDAGEDEGRGRILFSLS